MLWFLLSLVWRRVCVEGSEQGRGEQDVARAPTPLLMLLLCLMELCWLLMLVA